MSSKINSKSFKSIVSSRAATILTLAEEMLKDNPTYEDLCPQNIGSNSKDDANNKTNSKDDIRCNNNVGLDDAIYDNGNLDDEQILEDYLNKDLSREIENGINLSTISLPLDMSNDNEQVKIKNVSTSLQTNNLDEHSNDNGELSEVDDTDEDPTYVQSNNDKDESNSDSSIQADESTNKVKSRKRVRQIEDWKVSKRMKATISGKEHISKTGKLIKKKTLKPGCTCKKLCNSKIDQSVRQIIFSNYWNEMNTWNLKRQFVFSHVTQTPTVRRRPKDGSREDQRKYSVKYHFDVHNKKQDVCKKFFLNTLGISETVVFNVLKKQQAGGFISVDKRGRHTPPNKLPEDIRNRIRSHIKSFPTYESHYRREKSTKSYLGPELNKEKMYKLYKLHSESKGVPPNEIGKSWVYYSIFDTEFNLSFKVPSNDTCDKCDSFKLKITEAKIEVERLIFKNEHDLHLQEADRRYTEKKTDKELSQKNAGKTMVIMIDLQKCLPTPYLTNNQSFYCLKLWTLNLTIYDSTNKKSYCLVWNESVAGRGGNEISSALLKWAELTLKDSPIEHLIIWSDNCPSQNRNIMMLSNLFYILKLCPNIKIIEHKFLLRGHTHLEADHVHGLIEKTLKKHSTMEIITPWDWEQLMRSSGATVYRMELTDFKKIEALYSSPGSPYINRKQNVDKENFLISSVFHFKVQHDNEGIVFYKDTSPTSNFKKLNICRNLRKKTCLPNELPVLSNKEKGVSKSKKEHLLKLLTWVPNQFQDFFRKLPTSEVENDAL